MIENTNTPTPRTDAHFTRRLVEGGRTDKRNERFARQLERELAMAMAELDIQAQNSRRCAMVWKEIQDMRRAYEEKNG